MFNLLPQIQQKMQERLVYKVLKRIFIPVAPALQQAPEGNERPYRSTRMGFGSNLHARTQ